jgi:hypothetical protein
MYLIYVLSEMLTTVAVGTGIVGVGYAAYRYIKGTPVTTVLSTEADLTPVPVENSDNADPVDVDGNTDQSSL